MVILDKEDAKNILICLKVLKWNHYLKSHMPASCQDCRKTDREFMAGIKDLITRLEEELVEENK